ncbi:MAG: pantetheine-phosphate adenylyltransferase [Pseudomonadota bacterium]|nr:pantetheine-phosphate adenylyltransferase [Pseudomonadota bacterium]
MHAVFPGTFDPPTQGHVSIVERASRIFAQITVGISTSRRNAWLDSGVRLRLMVASCQHLGNVKCEMFDGLTADFAYKVGAKAIIRGLRTVNDYEYEKTMMAMNRQLRPDLTTVLLMTEPHLYHVSSSLIKEIVRVGSDPKDMLPAPVAKHVSGLIE